MITTAPPLLAELEQEADNTRRVLERVPADRLGWRPHPKSMTLGELALHVAQVPGQFAAHQIAFGTGAGAHIGHLIEHVIAAAFRIGCNSRVLFAHLPLA
jgi:hypothetical protein